MSFHIVLLIFLSIFKYSRSEDCVLDSKTRIDSAWDKKLHREKLNNYVSSEPPRNQSCVPVKVQFQMKSFAFDEYEGKFTTKVWGRLEWSDERLTWLPADYGGVEDIVVHNTDIWTPSLKLLNSVEPNFYTIEYGECLASNDGEILCVSELVYESFCSAILSDWPYDVQNCTLQFGNGDRLDVTRFEFGERAMSLFPAQYGNGWNIVLMNASENLNSDVQLSISLSMERQAYGLVVLLVDPCTIICILTTTSILLNVNDSVRLGFSCFSLISHFTFLFAIAEFLPKHSADTPVVLFFVRGSIIVTITSVLVTCILSKIVKRETVPFDWECSISNKVFGSFARYLIFPRWYVDSDSKDITVNNKEVWTNFGSILNSVYLVIIIIVYICMFCVYLPKQPPAESNVLS